MSIGIKSTGLAGAQFRLTTIRAIDPSAVNQRDFAPFTWTINARDYAVSTPELSTRQRRLMDLASLTGSNRLGAPKENRASSGMNCAATAFDRQRMAYRSSPRSVKPGAADAAQKRGPGRKQYCRKPVSSVQNYRSAVIAFDFDAERLPTAITPESDAENRHPLRPDSAHHDKTGIGIAPYSLARCNCASPPVAVSVPRHRRRPRHFARAFRGTKGRSSLMSGRSPKSIRWQFHRLVRNRPPDCFKYSGS